MPRVSSKRGLFWGTGKLMPSGLARTLDRRDRGEEWRKARNFRRWLRVHPDFTLELAGDIFDTVPDVEVHNDSFVPAPIDRPALFRRFINFIIWLWTKFAK